jgi:hypothetical protein
MNIFGSWERKTFLGEVVQDYGTIQDELEGFRRVGTSIFCVDAAADCNLYFAISARRRSRSGFITRTLTSRLKHCVRLGDILLDAHTHVDAAHAP